MKQVINNNQRLQICQQLHDKFDQMYYSETHDAYLVSPTGNNDCILINAKNGSYRSYADRYGVLRDMDKGYAKCIDNYLVKVSGVTR